MSMRLLQKCVRLRSNSSGIWMSRTNNSAMFDNILHRNISTTSLCNDKSNVRISKLNDVNLTCIFFYSDQLGYFIA